tara:strand:- start:219 stop:974 length:756 start_codon:yes stop_codon:yes gene_type:complete
MYIPKNKIITDLHTNIGNPNSEIADSNTEAFFIVNTGALYTGYYWKDYKGKYYTGKNPNDTPTQELVFTIPQKVNEENSPAFITTPNLPSNENLNQSSNSMVVDPFMTSDYGAVRQFTPLNVNIPTQHFPKPTDENYKLGTFRRYFCVKANEQIFIEINEKTFTLLQTEDEKWRWDLYVPFILDWVLTGNENNVRTTNFNSSKIIEVKNKGFQKFLRFNYLKFYQPPSKESTLSVPPRPSNNSTVDKSGNY